MHPMQIIGRISTAPWSDEMRASEPPECISFTWPEVLQWEKDSSQQPPVAEWSVEAFTEGRSVFPWGTRKCEEASSVSVGFIGRRCRSARECLFERRTLYRFAYGKFRHKKHRAPAEECFSARRLFLFILYNFFIIHQQAVNCAVAYKYYNTKCFFGHTVSQCKPPGTHK